MQDWEAKVALLTSEIERLRQVLLRKDEEIDQWKQKYFKLEATLQELNMLREKNRVLNAEIDRLNLLINELETENSQIKLKLVNINDLQLKITNLLMLCVQLFAEVEALRSRVKDKEKQVDEMRRSSLAAYRN